jgi:hypothetical protein
MNATGTHNADRASPGLSRRCGQAFTADDDSNACAVARFTAGHSNGMATSQPAAPSRGCTTVRDR